MNLRLHASSLLAAAFVLCAAPGAHASPAFPGTIQSHLSLNYTPDCTLCHTSSAGGTGTAVKPFALAMKSIGGLQSGNPATVGPALDTLAAQGHDSDGDCVDDITELKNHTDPNTADNPNACGDGGSPREGGVVPPSNTPPPGPTIGYGCGASRSYGAPGIEAWWPLAAVVALAFARARRRR